MIYDYHVHSVNSDGKGTVDELCGYALEKGICGFALTDHADMNYYEARDTYNRIKKSIADVKEAREKYKGRLELYTGVELGEYLWAPEKAKEILSIGEFDVVLCSIHSAVWKKWGRPYSRIEFVPEEITDEELDEYFVDYFDQLSKTAAICDYDVLAHIVCPARYMTGRYGRKTELKNYENEIAEIMKTVIARGAALEMNVAGFQKYTMQSEWLFKLYRDLGGRAVTIGQDTHLPSMLARNIGLGVEMLQSLGYDRYSIYKGRERFDIKI
ncbi:MAG: histidinol-phosphatase HisJ family protein [Clostridia bacterium]|nr:histidinol-phosphatase HisJ family protein [Clostridia bacterium]